MLKEIDGDEIIEMPKSEDADNSRVLRAKLLASSDSIAFSAKLGVFVVADQTAIYTVRLYPTESCTCPIKRNCIHILGVKIGQRMTINEEDLAIQKNTAVVRKNTRPTKQKPGRKRPRPGDISPVQKKEAKIDLDQVVRGLEESGIQPVNDSQLSKQSLDALIELEQVIQTELNGKSKLLPDETKQQMKTEHPMHEYSFINLITSTPKSPELLKDVRYSLEVWVPADKQKLFHNLNVNDRKILQKKTGWLNDTIIDSAMNLLQYQFPDLEGFQSCTLAVQLDFERHQKLFIQIINRSPHTKGTHWLTVRNINCMEDEVGIYDSAFDDLPHNEQLVVASLVKTEKKILKAKFSNVYMQTNGNDCGLYAIANATALAFGRDPSKEQYIPSKLREHLIQCLENKEMRPFPTAKGTSKRRKAIKKTENLQLYCVCKMPDTHTNYFLCDQCSDEYHPECLGLDMLQHKDRSFICPACCNQ